MTEDKKRILIIKLGALGDFILQTGQMKAIRDAYPQAHITLMTNKSFLKIAKQTGWFDDYIIDNRTWYPTDWIRIVHKLAFGHYDMIFDIQMQSRTKRKYYSLARLLAPHKFCWAFEAQKGYNVVEVTKACPLHWGHANQFFLPLPSKKATLEFCHGENKNFHLLPQKFVLIIPGCSPNHPYKKWPVLSYTDLVQLLAEQEIPSVVLGTSIEKKEIASICATTPMAVNFCDKASLLDIPDLARRSIMVVGNDTGPTHMAELVNKPTITLFCSKTKHCAYKAPNVHNIIRDSISGISVQEVMDQIQSIMHNA
ncbi:MAG: glycosyltransferase family 9 protein [Alphaproteobacteria bacterium]|nr:glycosyltransferase family 9 protein [Alphaproteobacteria bacterium]